MYCGRHFQGTEVSLSVLCKSASDVPVAPDAAPSIDVYSSTAKVLAAKTIPPIDRYGLTGLFGLRLFLDARYAAGLYTVVYRWVSGSFKGTQLDDFEVLPGSSADGTPIATYLYKRPHADFLVQQLDSGELLRGRNPTL